MSWPARPDSGPVLTETRHAAVDQGRIARQNRIRPETKPLHDIGTKPFDQHVGLFGKAQHQFGAFPALQVNPQDGAAVTVDVVFVR